MQLKAGRFIATLALGLTLGAVGALFVGPASSQNTPPTADQANCLLEHLPGVGSEKGAQMVYIACLVLHH